MPVFFVLYNKYFQVLTFELLLIRNLYLNHHGDINKKYNNFDLLGTGEDIGRHYSTVVIIIVVILSILIAAGIAVPVYIWYRHRNWTSSKPSNDPER